MSMEKNLNNFLEELIQEVENELDEATTSGAAGAYNTPNAFSDKGAKDKKLKKKIATQLGMKLVGKIDEDLNEATFRPNSGTMSGGTYGLGKRKYELKRDVKGVKIGDYTNVTLPKGTIIYNLPGGVFAHHRSLKSYEAGMNKYFNKPTFRGISIRREKNVILSIEKNSKILESVITERQFKGLDGIDDKTPLTKISDTQKLKIIQSTGNIISFFVPKGFDRNFWQVISKGKIKKQKDLSNNVVYILPGKMIGSPKFKSIKDLIKGVDWKSVEKARRFNESVNEAKIQRPVNRWLAIKNDETKHPHKKMAMGLKELKYQLAETQKFFNWYNKIKSMNELDSSDYWKRTNKHIYKIKERLINIAKTIQEIEK